MHTSHSFPTILLKFRCAHFFFFDKTGVLEQIEEIHILQFDFFFISIFFFWYSLAKIVGEILLQLIQSIFEHSLVSLLWYITLSLCIERRIITHKPWVCIVIIHFHHFVRQNVHGVLLTSVLHESWKLGVRQSVSIHLVFEVNVYQISLVWALVLISTDHVQFLAFIFWIILPLFILSTKQNLTGIVFIHCDLRTLVGYDKSITFYDDAVPDQGFVEINAVVSELLLEDVFGTRWQIVQVRLMLKYTLLERPFIIVCQRMTLSIGERILMRWKMLKIDGSLLEIFGWIEDETWVEIVEPILMAWKLGVALKFRPISL